MLQRLLRNAVILVVVAAAMLLLADVVSACPNCKDGIAANDPHHASIVRGYFYSILLMMGMPFALISCFSLYMYREVLKARARDAEKRDSVVARSPASVVAGSPASVVARSPDRATCSTEGLLHESASSV